MYLITKSSHLSIAGKLKILFISMTKLDINIKYVKEKITHVTLGYNV